MVRTGKSECPSMERSWSLANWRSVAGALQSMRQPEWRWRSRGPGLAAVAAGLVPGGWPVGHAVSGGSTFT